jgi:hypothetical protein
MESAGDITTSGPYRDARAVRSLQHVDEHVTARISQGARIVLCSRAQRFDTRRHQRVRGQARIDAPAVAIQDGPAINERWESILERQVFAGQPAQQAHFSAAHDIGERRGDGDGRVERSTWKRLWGDGRDWPFAGCEGLVIAVEELESDKSGRVWWESRGEAYFEGTRWGRSRRSLRLSLYLFARKSITRYNVLCDASVRIFVSTDTSMSSDSGRTRELTEREEGKRLTEAIQRSGGSRFWMLGSTRQIVGCIPYPCAIRCRLSSLRQIVTSRPISNAIAEVIQILLLIYKDAVSMSA